MMPCVAGPNLAMSRADNRTALLTIYLPFHSVLALPAAANCGRNWWVAGGFIGQSTDRAKSRLDEGGRF